MDIIGIIVVIIFSILIFVLIMMLVIANQFGIDINKLLDGIKTGKKNR